MFLCMFHVFIQKDLNLNFIKIVNFSIHSASLPKTFSHRGIKRFTYVTDGNEVRIFFMNQQILVERQIFLKFFRKTHNIFHILSSW